jgi:hypothetical protein
MELPNISEEDFNKAMKELRDLKEKWFIYPPNITDEEIHKLWMDKQADS